MSGCKQQLDWFAEPQTYKVMILFIACSIEGSAPWTAPNITLSRGASPWASEKNRFQAMDDERRY